MNYDSLIDSAFSGVIAGGLTAVLISGTGRINLAGMNVSAPVGVGVAVAGADVVAEMVKEPILDAWGLNAPTTRELSAPLISGLATYGVLRLGVSDRVGFVGSVGLGAVSSYASKPLRNAVWP